MIHKALNCKTYNCTECLPKAVYEAIKEREKEKAEAVKNINYALECISEALNGLHRGFKQDAESEMRWAKHYAENALKYFRNKA